MNKRVKRTYGGLKRRNGKGLVRTDIYILQTRRTPKQRYIDERKEGEPRIPRVYPIAYVLVCNTGAKTPQFYDYWEEFTLTLDRG